eukprot:1567000-Pyramimonas_sp.AAC.1
MGSRVGATGGRDGCNTPTHTQDSLGGCQRRPVRPPRRPKRGPRALQDNRRALPESSTGPKR